MRKPKKRGSLDDALTESLRTRPALQFPPGQNSVEFPESEAFFYILFNVYFLNEEKKEQNEKNDKEKAAGKSVESGVQSTDHTGGQPTLYPFGYVFFFFRKKKLTSKRNIRKTKEKMKK
jgi:hypothetical protein